MSYADDLKRYALGRAIREHYRKLSAEIAANEAGQTARAELTRNA